MTGTAKGVFVISFMVALWATGAAMAGTIEGIVKDGKTGNPLAGAAVRVVNSNLGATTDLDGKYSIQNINPGIYSLRISLNNYTQKVLPGVAVAGKETTSMDIALDPVGGEGSLQHIDDTYVVEDRIRNNIVGELAARQKSAVIGDGMTQEQIRLSPDRDAGDALKRVTGLSVVDDKFVFVRGVTDRYNSTTLNGATVTGTDTDSDKKSFSFDLIPSQLIASTIVAKTATPDLPGDFSGGLVQVNTLDFPSNFMLQAGIEAASDNVSSNKDVRVAPGGASDWKAKDDGTRAFPTGKTGVDIAKAMPNNWGTSGGNSNLNSNYGLAIGDKFDVGGGQIGFIGSATYKNSFKIEDYHQEPQGNGQDIFEFDGKRYREKYLWGGLANLSWHINENNKINFENNYTRSAEDKVTQAKGLAESRDSTRTQTISWAQRDIYLGQLKGQHTLSFAHGLDLNWRLTSTTSSAQEPDRKFAAYAKRAVANAPYLMNENYRTWSDLTEDTHGGALDAEYPVGGGSFKAGYAQNHRERDFSIDAYATDASKLDRKYRSLVLLPIDKIFDPDNYGKDANGKQMFGFIPFTAFTGEYNGTQDLHAYYGMYDSPFKLMHRGFRFAGGLRVEDSDQSVNTPKSIDDPTIIVSHQQNTDALPSANLTCEVTKTSNIRLGYYKSVNRPEFRELANVAYLDFDRNQTVIGNSNLERAVIRNYDVRMEWFPRPGEVLAASWFYKDLTNAIEEELLPSPDRYVRTWFNSPNGKNVGYEIEARKSLGFVTQSLQNLTVQGNFTHVSSDVEYKDSYTDQAGNPHTSTKTRPLQGQAPYTVNAGLTYSFPELGLSTSLLYNRFGRRLDSVGDSRDEDVYEESRDLLDFALTEQFTPWMRLKFTVKDMLAQDKVLTFGNSGSVWESVNTGTTYALSLAFSL